MLRSGRLISKQREGIIIYGNTSPLNAEKFSDSGGWGLKLKLGLSSMLLEKEKGITMNSGGD